jgi:hypothetical protein
MNTGAETKNKKEYVINFSHKVNGKFVYKNAVQKFLVRIIRTGILYKKQKQMDKLFMLLLLFKTLYSTSLKG